MVETLIKQGANVNSSNINGWSVLHLGNNLNKYIFILFELYYINEAVVKGHVNVVETLIKQGAKVNSINFNGCSVLHLGIYLKI
jgi:ankyrin repeat protein